MRATQRARRASGAVRRSGVIALTVLVLLVAVGCEAAREVLGGLGMAGRAGAEASLTASGTITARELRIGSELGGRIAAVVVRQGTAVRSGDPLVELDPTPWELALLSAEAALEVARAEVAVLEAGVRAERVQAAQAAVALAEARRDGAHAAWERALDRVASPQELDAQLVEARTGVALAEQGVELAEAQLQPAQVQRDIQRWGSPERAAAENQLRAAEYALAGAQADLATAQALLNHLWRIRQQPLGYIAQADAAQGHYEVAVEGVRVAQAQLEDLLAGPTAEELAVAHTKVRQAEAEVALLRLKIARATLRSPIDGVVLTQVHQIGELAAPASPILVLADLDVVQLVVYVAEPHIGRVRGEAPVTVTVQSLPGRVFVGRVARMSDEPEYTPRNVATAEERLNTFYAVEIELANAERLLKPGMPANAAFPVGP